jgi:hypothetical protein
MRFSTYFVSIERFFFDEDGADDMYLLLGGDWARKRWWQRLARVCSRWRKLILELPFSLRLCLVCTYGTPVAEMFAHLRLGPRISHFYFRHPLP